MTATTQFADSHVLAASVRNTFLTISDAGLGGVVLRRTRSEPALPTWDKVATVDDAAKGGMSLSPCPALSWADMEEVERPFHEDLISQSSGSDLDPFGTGGAELLSLQPQPVILLAPASEQVQPSTRTPLKAPSRTPLKSPVVPSQGIEKEGAHTRLSAKAKPFVAGFVAAAGGPGGAATNGTKAQSQWNSPSWGYGYDYDEWSWGDKEQDVSPARSDSGAQTTMMMRNIPCTWTRDRLLALLDAKGFSEKYDFVYLPIDFESAQNLGYAFVNLAQDTHVARFREVFNGYGGWRSPSCRKVCHVCFGETHGLEGNVDRYRNSAVMAPSVPDGYKPAIFCNGARQTFPPPTQEIREPRPKFRGARGQQRGAEVC